MAKKLSPFEEAFKEARAKGEKTFPFNGKSYSTVTGDDVQKRIDKMPSMSRTQGETKITQGATYPKPAAAPAPKPKADEKSLLDKYRESDTAKGFRDARATFGDTPSTDMLMRAGQVGIAAMPVGRALSAVRPAIGAAAQSFKESLKDFKQGIPPKKFRSDEEIDFPIEQFSNKLGGYQVVRELENNTGVKDLPNTNPDKKYGQRQGFLGRTKDGLKKGGVVKKMASGGKVSASSRGDGIAQRGKTKGRMC